jgi:hypothetical protein
VDGIRKRLYTTHGTQRFASGMEAANRLGVLRLADEMQWMQFLQADARAG